MSVVPYILGRRGARQSTASSACTGPSDGNTKRYMLPIASKEDGPRGSVNCKLLRTLAVAAQITELPTTHRVACRTRGTHTAHGKKWCFAVLVHHCKKTALLVSPSSFVSKESNASCAACRFSVSLFDSNSSAFPRPHVSGIIHVSRTSGNTGLERTGSTSPRGSDRGNGIRNR